MNHFSFMLADADINDIIQQGTTMDPRMYEFLITFGAIGLAILIAVIWAVVYSLKKKKRKGSRHRVEREEPARKSRRRPVQVVREVSLEAEPQKHSHRRRRRHRRPLNPTLAQTGGLPPMRDENTPLPPMP